MNKNILIVLLVLIIVILGYLQFRTKDMVVPNEQTKASNRLDTDNSQPPKDLVTKNYSGNNFTVEYPSSNVYEDTATYTATLGAKAVEFFNGDPNNGSSDAQISYVVFIKDNVSDNKALDSYSKNLIKHINGGQSFPISEKSFSVAGRTGIQYSYKAIAGGYDGTVYVTAVVHDSKAYIIQFVDGTYPDYMNFVSSFKFQ